MHTRFAVGPEQALFVESEFLLKEMDEKLRGFFLLLPDPASLGVILRSVRT
jgi:chemotaxis protein CheC